MDASVATNDVRPQNKRSSGELLNELWGRYHQARDVDTRNRLIEAHVWIVKREARKVAATLTSRVSAQELESAGILGLIDAIDTFDLAQGFKFVTFATPRIRGAMFDELRSWDWTPRATRAKLNRLERAMKALEGRLGRAPDDAELALETGLSENEVQRLFHDKSRALVSLDAPMTPSRNSRTKEDSQVSILEDERGTDPVRDLQKKEIAEAVRKMLGSTERLVVTLYYYEQFNLREIGQVLGLTESRICQIHTKIVERLKKQFA